MADPNPFSEEVAKRHLRAMAVLRFLLPGLFAEHNDHSELPEMDLITTLLGGIDLLVGKNGSVTRHLFLNAAEIEEGTYKEIFYPRLREILGHLK